MEKKRKLGWFEKHILPYKTCIKLKEIGIEETSLGLYWVVLIDNPGEPILSFRVSHFFILLNSGEIVTDSETINYVKIPSYLELLEFCDDTEINRLKAKAEMLVKQGVKNAEKEEKTRKNRIQ